MLERDTSTVALCRVRRSINRESLQLLAKATVETALDVETALANGCHYNVDTNYVMGCIPRAGHKIPNECMSELQMTVTPNAYFEGDRQVADDGQIQNEL